MKFENYDFSSMNETDIREEIIAPLLRYLGYRSNTSADIIREQSLRYPKISIGRKNNRKDPELQGRADYVCEIDKSVRWVIEAKSSQSKLTLDDAEQAYTYANHSEVRAVYFCLVNGPEIKVYQTNQGPGNPPVLELKYEELQQSLPKLSNVLGPDAIRRDHPRVEVDTGLPIGKGLRSTARVTGGIVSFESNSAILQILNEMTLNISSGCIERDEEGYLVARLKSSTPFRSLNELNAATGIESMNLVSKERELSSDSSKPTLLQEVTKMALPAGDMVYNPYSWSLMRLPQSLSCKTETWAEGILTGRSFHGDFRLRYSILELNQVVDASGRFEIHLL